MRLRIDGDTRLLVLTGAGVSAESGVPTFRDANGLWENHPVEQVATPQGFRADPALVWRFYSDRRRQAKGVAPNPGHVALAAIEERLGDRFLLVTQNIDALHRRAGSRRVVEIHGSLFETRCERCDRPPFADDALHDRGDVPACDACAARGRAGRLRPNIVWFGEMLDPLHMQRIEAFMESLARRAVRLPRRRHLGRRLPRGGPRPARARGRGRDLAGQRRAPGEPLRLPPLRGGPQREDPARALRVGLRRSPMRGAVSVQGVRKTYGDVVALDDVSLDVRARRVPDPARPLGLRQDDAPAAPRGLRGAGRGAASSISGRDVAGLPPYERPVNTVFQHYALFPHRTVAGNVAFGLEARGLGRGRDRGRRWRARSRWCASPASASAAIDQLSGGQKQRVALARAVVLEPEVLLLDEPMAALDLKLRKEMQVEVKNLQERLQTTFVFVTHDQDEALIMSDRIAVMSQGRIEQLERTEALYERPRTRFVADFLGVKNILEATSVRRPARARPRLRTRGRPRAARRRRRRVRAPATTVLDGHPARAARPRRTRRRGQRAGQGTLDDEIYLGDWTDWRVRARRAAC